MTQDRWRHANTARAATLLRCPNCGERVLSGLDADRCALLAFVNPTPINEPRREGAALLAGRASFNVRGQNSRPTIWRRSVSNYGRGYPCYLEHLCGEPVRIPEWMLPKTQVEIGEPPY